MDAKEIKNTCNLVEELKKREGVQSIYIKPYEKFKILENDVNKALDINQGPVQILIICD